MESSAAAARRMWTLFEPVHVMTYFAPQARTAFEEAGLRGFWRGYFAGRAAPLGAVDAPPVVAAFCSFAPPFVRRAIPAVWDLITPAEALRVREAGAVAAIRARLGCEEGQPAPPAVGVAADLLSAAAEDLDAAGRSLGAPNAALPVPAEPVARLWRAATVLREHRGDGHVAALVAAGIDGCEALVLRAATDLAVTTRPEPGGTDAGGTAGSTASAAGGTAPGAPAAGWTGLVLTRAQLQAVRGWSDDDMERTAHRLYDRGWLDSVGAATATGLDAHRAVEAATDRAAAGPWARLGEARTAQLVSALAPVALACAAVLPYPNPVGVPRPGGHGAARVALS